MSEALNVTKAAFGGLREVTTAPLWQYDYGQILKITGLDLPQAFEVHFSNSRKSGETITQIGTDGQVTIPDMFLTSGADIYAFIFLHDGLTDGETEYVIKIPVRERPEPSDIEPTPEQQDVITQTIAALNDAVEQSESNVEHYPRIIDGYWNVWDAQTEQFVSTGVEAQGEKGDGGLCIFLDRTGSPIPTDADKHLPASATVTCGVYCFKGGERIDPENVTASAFQYKSGQYSASLPATITHNTAEAAQWRVTYNLNASNNITLLGDSGSQLIKVTVDGEVHKIYYPWFAAKQGETGEGGLNIDLTMDAIIIPTDPDRMPDSEYQATIDITADRDGEVVGIETVSATIVSMEYVDGQGVVHRTGVVPSISAMHDSTLDIDIKYTVKYKFKYDPYYFVADSGTVTITIRIGSKNYTRIIPWTLSKQGIQGEQGETGATPDFTIGTVQTLPAGSQATASITGTDEEPVLNLGLPKGDAGNVQDVQVNGTSVVNQGVASIPLASPSAYGVTKGGRTSVSGITPSITAEDGVQYICGEVATLDITLPDSGIVDVVFTSGSTPTVLTVTPPTGQTVRWANGFDPTALEANTTYEVNFLNGLGAVMAWT